MVTKLNTSHVGALFRGFRVEKKLRNYSVFLWVGGDARFISIPSGLTFFNFNFSSQWLRFCEMVFAEGVCGELEVFVA